MYATSSHHGLSSNALDAPHDPRFTGAFCVDVSETKPLMDSSGQIRASRDARYAAETKGTSIFGIKFCHFSPKRSKNEGISVDVDENKRTKSVTLGISVDIVENTDR